MHIDHIAIWTTHLERLKDFYIRYFGAQASQKYTLDSSYKCNRLVTKEYLIRGREIKAFPWTMV